MIKKVLSFTNKKTQNQIFALEPWGQMFELKTDEVIEVEYSPDPDSEDPIYGVVVDDEAITLYVENEFKMLRLIKNGVELTRL